MTKRMLSMLLLMTLVLLPAAQASAAYTRYVYTENGKTLNVRDSQMIGENVVGAVRCGAAVNVIQEYGDGPRSSIPGGPQMVRPATAPM